MYLGENLSICWNVNTNVIRLVEHIRRFRTINEWLYLYDDFKLEKPELSERDTKSRGSVEKNIFTTRCTLTYTLEVLLMAGSSLKAASNVENTMIAHKAYERIRHTNTRSFARSLTVSQYCSNVWIFSASYLSLIVVVIQCVFFFQLFRCVSFPRPQFIPSCLFKVSFIENVECSNKMSLSLFSRRDNNMEHNIFEFCIPENAKQNVNLSKNVYFSL